jgi:hypothetical protein
VDVASSVTILPFLSFALDSSVPPILRQASNSTVAVMEANPDSWPAYVTHDDGRSFYPSMWKYREFPLPPSLIQLVDKTTVETSPVRVFDLRLALAKWRDLVSLD